MLLSSQQKAPWKKTIKRRQFIQSIAALSREVDEFIRNPAIKDHPSASGVQTCLDALFSRRFPDPRKLGNDVQHHRGQHQKQPR
jgi:hypothetical protein